MMESGSDKRSGFYTRRWFLHSLGVGATALAIQPTGLLASRATWPGKLPAMPRSTLRWNLGDLIDPDEVKAYHINFLHTFPRPAGMRGMTPAAMQQDWLVKWSRQLDRYHENGIFVLASVGSTCFNPEVFRQCGLDPDRYYARDDEGNFTPMLGGSYGNELITSCYSNPHWIGLLTDIVVSFARAGFDGIWYDVGGYVDSAVLYCQCQHCKAGWRDHLVSIGESGNISLPTKSRGLDYTRRMDRIFLKWRWQEWIKWEKIVQDAVRKDHPKFVFAHNLGVREGGDRGVGVFLHTTTDLFDFVHWEEWGHGTAPYSDIPSYLLGIAAGKGKQVMLVQNDKPRRNALQHKIFLAEAYASGGLPQVGVNLADETRSFFQFIDRFEDVYTGNVSMANVVVVYSWWSQAVFDHPNQRWPAHWMGRLLLDLHIPFDYLIAERDLKPGGIPSQYKTLILPGVSCMTDEQMQVVTAFVQTGGNLIITGPTAMYDEELRTRSTPFSELMTADTRKDEGRWVAGNGKIAYFKDCPAEIAWKEHPRDFAKNEVLNPPTLPPAPVMDTFRWVTAGTLPMEVDAAITTVVIPRRKAKKVMLHCVNYNVYPDATALTPDRGIKVRLTSDRRATVSDIRVISPDFEDEVNIRDWQQEGDVLRFILPELQTYSVVIINFT